MTKEKLALIMAWKQESAVNAKASTSANPAGTVRVELAADSSGGFRTRTLNHLCC